MPLPLPVRLAELGFATAAFALLAVVSLSRALQSKGMASGAYLGICAWALIAAMLCAASYTYWSLM